MKDCFLANYDLSCLELLQSIVVSEYGLRHLQQADLQPQRKWVHRTIATIQFVPILGQIAMLVEWAAFKILFCNYSSNNVSQEPYRELLFKGTQEQAEGPVSPERVQRLVDSLNQRRENGILFNPSKITSSTDGGTCTAMAFDFVEEFFKLRKFHVLTDQYAHPLFLNALSHLGQRFARSSEEMRHRQAAFNTIETTPHPQGMDIAKNKVQSLANFHHFNIEQASSEIQVDRTGYERTLKEEVTKLHNGVYLLRTIKPCNNERQEFHGHSMIYVKNQKEGFFYDPNYGTRYIKDVDHLPDLSEALTGCFRRFETSKARFYRLAPSAPLQA